MATKIEWTRGDDDSPGETWNPTTGCDRVSPGCDNCYALTMAARLKGMGQAKYQTDGDPRTSGPGFGLAMHPDTLDAPLRWRKPRRVFVNSMSDLFHPKVTDEFIFDVFAVMAMAEQHTFQVLTKRPKRMRGLLSHVPSSREPLYGQFSSEQAVKQRVWQMVLKRENPAAEYMWFDAWWQWPLRNVWLGTSVEDQRRADERIPELLDTPAAVRFLSCEPLLGPVDLRLGFRADRANMMSDLVKERLHWVIVGGESGAGSRPMDLLWAARIVGQCRAADVAVFVKQLGSRPYVQSADKRWSVEDPKGGDPEEWPTNLRVRDYPQGPA